MYEFYHYLPVTDTVMQCGLYLTGIGRGVIPSQENYPPVGHPTLYSFNYRKGRILPEFQLIIITDGKGIFESKQTGPVPIESNTFIILFPDIWHRYKPDEQTGWKERWVSLNGMIVHQLMDQGYLAPQNAISILPDPPGLISVFDQFLDDIHKKPTQNTLINSLNTMALLNKVIKATGHDLATKDLIPTNIQYSVDDPLVKMALDIIWTHSHRPISTEYILEHVPASRRTLERRFRRVCGLSIHEEIIQCRLNRAKRLLLETLMPIKMVAYLSGFSDAEQMRYAFEKTLGQLPSQFRNENALANL